MFRRELSQKILKLIDEKEMALETLAEISDLSRKFIGNIVSEKQAPTLDSFEKICAALEVTPDQLLLPDTSWIPEKAKAMSVKQVRCFEDLTTGATYYSVCPGCNKTLERDYQAYCDRCGQRLSWKEFSKAEVIYTVTEN